MKKLFTMAAIALFTMTSCSDDDAAPTNPDTPNPVTTLLKKTIETYEDGSTITRNYTYNGNKLVSMIDDEVSTIFTYQGDLMTKIEYFEGTTLFQTNVLAYDPNNKLKTHTMYLHTQNSSERSEYIYNSNGTITVERFHGTLTEQTIQSNSYTVTMNNNNVMKVDTGTATKTFAYTTTIEPHSVITSYNSWTLAFLDGGVNNVDSLYYASSTGNVIEDTSYTYTYNANGTPATSVETDEETGEEITTQLFY